MSDLTPSDGSPRVALVTGGARGIGAATCRLLVQQGWRVVAFDRCADDEALDYPLATIADLDSVLIDGAGAVIGAVGDVRSASDLGSAVAEAEESFGGLDAVVACAGVISGGSPLWDMTDQAWHEQLAINLTGVFNTVRAAMPALLRRPSPRSGRIVAVASAAGLVGNDKLAAYNASKAGVIGLVRGLAADLADSGITANAVCPGSTRTDLLDHSAAIYDLADVDEFAVHHLVGRLLDPAEVAAAIAWLASPASSGLSGAILPVDGGMTV